MVKISEKHKANLKIQEEARLEKERVRLLNLKGGFALADYKPKPKVRALQPQLQNTLRTFDGRLPAKADPVPEYKSKDGLTESMAKRESLAQEEIKIKRSLCMPLYNKGGPQYPTATDLVAFRNGELRRRS